MMVDRELKENILKALSKKVRQDGRTIDQFRDIEIELGVVEMAEGSARVKCGDTEVIAGVKLKKEKPYSDTPDQGILMVNTELTALSNPRFEPGPPSIEAIETSRVVDRGLREGHAIDAKKLCIEAGESVWVVNVDVCPLNHDGNLIDIAGLAALAAIHNAKFPVVKEDGHVDYKSKTDKGLPLDEEPLPITVGKIGDHFLIDMTENEEKVIDARLTLTFRSDGTLCAVQKGGDGPLTSENIETMIDIAKTAAIANREILKKAVK